MATKDTKQNECRQTRKWCGTCKSNTHRDKACRKQSNKNSSETVSHVNDQVHNSEHSFVFTMNQDGDNSKGTVNSLLVDCGATSHIISDDSNFINFDKTFKPEERYIEYCVILNSAELITKDGTKFDIIKEGKPYFLNNVITHVKTVRDLKDWHRTLGHCSKHDIVKLEGVMEGMTIKNKEDFICDPCIFGKQTQTFSRQPSIRANSPLEFVTSDVCGPIDSISTEGFRYTILFTDNYSGYVFI